MFGIGKDPPQCSEDVAEALTAVRQARERAERLNSALQAYATSPNPFGRFAADVINRDFDQPRAK